MKQRANYFSDEIGIAEFHQAFIKLLVQVRQATTNKYLRPENTYRFKHGGQWAHPAASEAFIGDTRAHSSAAEVTFERLVNHDLGLIREVIGKITEDMERQFAQTMYSTVSAAAEKAGNSVDGQSAGSPREAFAQALEKIQFSADKFGNVALPEIHLNPETAEKLRKSIDEAPPEFNQRIEEIKARKIAEAREHEEQRKSRFLHYGRIS